MNISCGYCGLPANGEDPAPALMIHDGWGWITINGHIIVVCPGCIRSGVKVDKIAQRGIN